MLKVVCYERSANECILNFIQDGLLASLPLGPVDNWPPISLQIGPGTDDNWLSSFSPPSDLVYVAPSGFRVLTPATTSRAIASFRLGSVAHVGNHTAWICIASACTNEGVILIRGVYEWPERNECDQSNSSPCSLSVASVDGGGAAIADSIVLLPASDDSAGDDCDSLSTYTGIVFNPYSVDSVVSSTNLGGGSQISRTYILPDYRSYSGRTYSVCFCSADAGCERLAAFTHYVGAAHFNSPISRIALVDPSVIRVTGHHFTVSVHSVSVIASAIHCAVGSITGATAPSSSSIRSCSFTGCIATARCDIAATDGTDSRVHFRTVSNMTGRMHVWCFHESMEDAVYPGTPNGLVVVLPNTSPPPLIEARVVVGRPIVIAPISSEGRYSVSTTDQCYFQDMIDYEGSVSVIGVYTLCYCDQFSDTASTCPGWDLVGTIEVTGPDTQTPTEVDRVDPAAISGVVKLTLSGFGLNNSNRVAVLKESEDPSDGVSVQSPPSSVSSINATLLLDQSLFAVGDQYTVWWCPQSFPCSVDPLAVRTIEYGAPSGCVMSKWVAQESCSLPCNGGTYTMTRYLTSGSHWCNDETMKMVPCNIQPCPPPVVRSAALTWMGEDRMNFEIGVVGENLRPRDDLVALITSDSTCSDIVALAEAGLLTLDNPGVAIPDCRKDSTGTALTCWSVTPIAELVLNYSSSGRICYCSRSLSPDCNSLSSFTIQPLQGSIVSLPVMGGTWADARNTGSSSLEIILGVCIGFISLVFVMTGYVMHSHHKRQKRRVTSTPAPFDDRDLAPPELPPLPPVVTRIAQIEDRDEVLSPTTPRFISS